MSLLARCPHCRHEFPIAPRFRGQEVACVACDERFLFIDGPELPDTGEEYVAEVPAEETAEPEIDVELVSVSSRRGHFRRAVRLGLFCVLPALLVGGGSVYVWHRWQSRPADAGGPPAADVGWPVADAPVGFDPETVLTLHVSGAKDPFVQEYVIQRAGSLVDPGPRGTSGARSSGDRMTILVAPVTDPQAASQRIDFGVVEDVHGRVITVRAGPVPGLPAGADAVDRALFALQRPKAHWAMGLPDAMRDLTRLRVDHRRKDVAKALEQALADEDVGSMLGNEILEALGVWGTEDSVPAIEKHMNGLFGFHSRGTALMALGKIKGKRALEIIMLEFDRGTGLGVGVHVVDAKPAIIAFGPGAEDAVLERFRPDDPGRHVVICHILQEIGTQKSIPILEAAVEKNRFLEPHARAAAQSIQARRK
jgi:hypothetical protein